MKMAAGEKIISSKRAPERREKRPREKKTGEQQEWEQTIKSFGFDRDFLLLTQREANYFHFLFSSPIDHFKEKQNSEQRQCFDHLFIFR